MKAKHALLVALFLMLGLMSCENNNHFNIYQFSDVYDPEEAVSNVNIGIASSRSFGINGGSAPFQAKMVDEKVATVHIEGDGFSISPVQLGETSLVVQDSNGEVVKISVKVIKSTQSFYTKKVDVKIEGNLSDDAKTALEKKVIEDSDISAENVVGFLYDKRDSGVFTIASSRGASASVTGTFKKEVTTSDIYYYVTYNGTEHTFYLGEYRREEVDDKTTRDIGPLYYSLIEDVTDVYKDECPGVTLVERYCKSITHLLW